jgi:oligopeptide transport system substrate-binding protein
MKRFVYLVILSVLFSALSLTSCSNKKTLSVLRYNNAAEPQYLDPGKATGIPEFTVLLNLFDGLTRYNEQNEIIPSMAEKWEGPNEKNEYTFYLRKGTVWSNGDPVTAFDFEYSWKRALSPELASEYAYQLYYLKNGKAFNSCVPAKDQVNFTMKNQYYYPKLDEKGNPMLNEDKSQIPDMDKPFLLDDIGVKALDEQTLSVTLEASTPFFLSLLTFTTYLPVNHLVVEKNPDWAKSTEDFIGNGPFKMKTWVHADKIEVVKNEKYWDADVVKLSQIVFTMVDNQTTELALWESGQLDVATNPPPIEFDRLKKEDKLSIFPYLGTYYYAFNTTKKPFDDVRVRKALSFAINRQSIVDNITKAEQKPAMAFVPFGIPDSTSDKEFRTVGGEQFFADNNLEEAKSLLAEAGFPGGAGFPAITILYNTGETHQSITQAIQQMWKEGLGIQCNLMNQEWKVYLDKRSSLDYDVARAGWIGDFMDPSTFLDTFYSASGTSDTGWKNPSFDALIEKARSANDNFLRMRNLHDAELIMMEDMPVAPIYFYTRPMLVSKNLQHYISSSLGYTDFKWAEMVTKTTP